MISYLAHQQNTKRDPIVFPASECNRIFKCSLILTKRQIYKLAFSFLVIIIFNGPNCALNNRAAKMLTAIFVVNNTTYINATSLDLRADILSYPSGDFLKNLHGVIYPRKNIQHIEHILSLKTGDCLHVIKLKLNNILGFYIRH